MEVTQVPDEDGIHHVLLTRYCHNMGDVMFPCVFRSNAAVAWGFRLAGGQDEGISLKLSKVHHL